LSALFADEYRGRWLVVHKSGEVLQSSTDFRSLRAYLDAESTEHLVLRIPRKEDTQVLVVAAVEPVTSPTDEVKA
jgi:hypothetical protein